jgi:hypothetical protein
MVRKIEVGDKYEYYAINQGDLPFLKVSSQEKPVADTPETIFNDLYAKAIISFLFENVRINLNSDVEDYCYEQYNSCKMSK